MATENVIAFPMIPRATAIGNSADVTLQGVRLPRRVYARLLRIAALWDLEPHAVAEMLLVAAINKAVGIKRERPR